MADEPAEARGRTMLRPWRVGVLADITSPEAVREAIAGLSGVWGGQYMPILDSDAPISELERLGRQYDVDSLYADVIEGPLGDLLRKPGWRWSGRGRWGPFGQETGWRKGLLPVRALIDSSTDLLQPTWNREDPSDLVFAATWGLADSLGIPLQPSSDSVGPRAGSHRLLASLSDTGNTLVGALAAGSIYIQPQPRLYLEGYSGVYVIRLGEPRDVVDFWNLRTYGTRVIGVPSDGEPEILDLLLRSGLPSFVSRSADGRESRALTVWGLEDASVETAQTIKAVAEREGLRILPSPREHVPNFIFQGLRTPFVRSIRAVFQPAARSVDVALPSMPIWDEPDEYRRGIVAAEVRWHRVSGQDTRLTASVPPYRRHAALLEHAAAVEGIDHVRVSHAGICLGIDAGEDNVRIPFVYNLDAMRLLFDDDAVAIVQSDVGKFQSRAAEKFGGVYSGVFNQPGVRAAIELAAGRNAGVTLPHLRQVVERNRGSWPDPLLRPRLDSKEYARREVNYLLHSGLFVPTLKVHCSHCRVEHHVSADELASTMTCEFCGHLFNLALSHALVQPEWRYRLAAHLRADQVQALLPALAVTSFLGQFRHIEGPPMPQVLGLEVSIEGRKIETDVAVYFPDPDWTAVFGEVKTANRIDEQDVFNLEFLQRRLDEKEVRCLLLFATLKSKFSPQEVAVLRALVSRSGPVRNSNGMLLPNMPLVLTGPDLSHPPGDENHPWRWESRGQSGMFGTAITSCERNLGLRGYELRRAGDGLRFDCEWDS